MDPNAALEIIRQAIRLERTTTDTRRARAAMYEALDAMAGLDEWLSSGGFLPEAWKR